MDPAVIPSDVGSDVDSSPSGKCHPKHLKLKPVRRLKRGGVTAVRGGIVCERSEGDRMERERVSQTARSRVDAR